MKRFIHSSASILASSNVVLSSPNGKHTNIKAKIIDDATYNRKKNNLTYQFKQDNYRVYSEPGKEQYTWNWYAVPYGDRLNEK